MKIRSMLLGAIALSSMMVAGGDKLITQNLTKEQQELKELKKFCKLLPLDIKKIIIKDVKNYLQKLFEDSDEWLERRLRHLELRKGGKGVTGKTCKLLRSDNTEISFNFEDNQIVRSSTIPILKKTRVARVDLINEKISGGAFSPDFSKVLVKKLLPIGTILFALGDRDAREVIDDLSLEFDNHEGTHAVAISNDGKQVGFLEFIWKIPDIGGEGRYYNICVWDSETKVLKRKRLFTLPFAARNNEVKSFSFNHKGTKLGACFTYDVYVDDRFEQDVHQVKITVLDDFAETLNLCSIS